MRKEISPTARVDKWLWAARFYKTRAMAARAVNGGKVHVNGKRAKASRIIAVNDTLTISIGTMDFCITVQALSTSRRPAKEASLLYLESADSIKTRKEYRDFRRMANAGYTAPTKKPSKRDRRKIKYFTRKNELE